MTRLRIGCVGTGFIAGRHLRALSAIPEVRVVAVADSVAERADAAARQYDARAYASGAEMLEHADLDAVWLCVPPFAHGPLERAAAERRLPFFVEKPIALDLATALDVAAVVARNDVATAVGYHWRHLGVVEEAVDLLAESPAHLALGYWLDATPAAPWWSLRRQSGGQVLEQGTHLFDLLRLLVGEVQSVAAVERTLARPAFPEADVPTVSSASLVFESGAVGSVSCTCLLEARHRVGVTLVGDGIGIELREGSLNRHELRVSGRVGTRSVISEEDPIAAEDRDFVEVVAGRRARPRVTYAQAVRTQRVVCAVDEAARSGVNVVLADGAVHG